MGKDFVVTLLGDNQPSWAIGHHKIYVWYFENAHGEQWVAKREGDILRFTGLEISWQEIVLSLEQAKAELSRLKEYLLFETLRIMPQYNEVAKQIIETRKMTAVTMEEESKLPPAEWINDAEIYWIVSVLEASIPMMEWARKKK